MRDYQPTQVGKAEVDRMLREQVAQAGSGDQRHPEWALAGLALVPLALIRRRR